MRSRRPFLLAALSLAALGSAGAQQSAVPGPVVQVDWLRQHLGDPDIVVLHLAQTRREYLTEHIPGARFVWFGAVAPSNPDLSTELPTVAQLDSVLESVGVGDRSRIVVYGAQLTPLVARLALTLDWLGAGDRTTVLDGGLAAWKAAGGAVTTDVPAVKRASFTPRVRREAIVDADFVKANLENVAFNSLLDDKGMLKPAATLAELLSAAGAKPGDRVVTYCHVGQQASLLWLAARQAGYRASVYDGSFEDWSGRPELPVVGPTSRP
jgi:thiosulfate/3-mercaptopyruvate sulfurtransferase